MNIKKDKRHEEFTTNKLLIVFSLVFIGIFSSSIVKKIANDAQKTLLVFDIVNYFVIGIGVLTIIFLIKWLVEIKNKKDVSLSYFSGKNLFFTFATFEITLLITKIYTPLYASKYVILFLSAIAALYFILVTFSKEIYLISLSNVVNIGIVYIVYKHSNDKVVIILPILLVVSLIFMYFIAKKAQNNDGMFMKRMLFSQNSQYKLIKINSLCLSFVALLSVAIAITGRPYGIIVAAIYFVIIIFYNTIKII